MNDLLLLRTASPEASETAEADHAPEFRYLSSYCLLQVRKVFGFGGGTVTVGEEGWRPQPGQRFDAVLILGSSNVLISQGSLRRMLERLRSGASEVRPYRLADIANVAEIGLGGGPPIYTLRGYERAEHSFLGRGDFGIAPPSSPPPVALLSFERFESLAASTSLGRILREPEPGISYAGLCHEFIDYYGEARSDILGFIPEGTPGGLEVLEVGCARGVTGKLIQDRFGCRVTGIELNPVVAQEAARHLHRVFQGDVQELEIEGGYDVVLALEVVEHLVEAESFLARLKGLLAPGGRAILSIPNVGHYSVIEDLIAGRWDYLPIGLLCYTHYRFFTRRTLEDWLRRSGIERFEILPQKTEAPEHLERFEAFEHDPESLATKGFYVLIYA